MVTAIYHPDIQMAAAQLQLVIVQRRMELESFQEIHEQLSVLLGAEKVPMECQQMIHSVLKRITRATNNGVSYPPE